MRRSVDPRKLESEIASLPDLGLVELRERWKKLYGCPAPKSFRRNLLTRAIAYQMQVEAYGGLRPPLRQRLRRIADTIRAGSGDPLALGPRIKTGTKLIRSWQGVIHTVTALENGFEWQGSRYRSLSEIARRITGTRWNGLVFFGVKPRPAGNKNALKRWEPDNAGRAEA